MAETKAPVVELGGIPVTLARSTNKDAQIVWCDECPNHIIWDVSHPYWGAGQTKAMHERGTGHKVSTWKMAEVPACIS